MEKNQLTHGFERRVMYRENKDGLIDGETSPEPPTAEVAADAIAKLRAAFPEEQVDLYLLTLLALDPETWQGVRAVLQPKR